ncbi:unnamed protein product [Anisakis simplex]|uniref:PAS domain-containing protein n=1 Tax=Anisakis simplex TaxID=6269 RepID=A0A0M3JLS5_ANISI|nr:unnamed protein product [Anisakis simplex]
MTGFEADDLLGNVDGTFLVHKAMVKNKTVSYRQNPLLLNTYFWLFDYYLQL